VELFWEVGVIFVMEFCPKIIAAVCFDAGAGTFLGDGSKEMVVACMSWSRGCTSNMCNWWEEEMEALEDFGEGVGRVVKEVT